MKDIQMDQSALMFRLKKAEAPIVIFGASTVGQSILHQCNEQAIKIKCFCDNKNYKINRTYAGLPVLTPELVQEKLGKAIFIIAAADIADVVHQLEGLGINDWYAGGQFFGRVNYREINTTNETDEFFEYVVGACKNCHDAFLTPGKIFMRSVDLMVTEKCSLKCKDCSNLMQYYQKPVNYELEQMQNSVDKLLALTDSIQEIRIIGGEPFMNKSFHIVIKQLIDSSEVQRIVVYTNGTISPPDEKLQFISSKKVMVLITDYGDLSRNKSELIEALNRNKIAYHMDRAKGWTECGEIYPHNRTETEQKGVFATCCAKSLITISNGKLYRCPFSANAAQLQAIPDVPEDYMNLEYMDISDLQAAKELMYGFLNNKQFLNVCDFCNGRPLNAPEIIPGIQIQKAISYKKFS